MNVVNLTLMENVVKTFLNQTLTGKYMMLLLTFVNFTTETHKQKNWNENKPAFPFIVICFCMSELNNPSLILIIII